MINRWQGNSGRVQRLPERGDRIPERSQPPSPKPEPSHPPYQPPKRPGAIFPGLEGLKKLLPQRTEELETEDIILLLILYLMYRESGDSELLMIMGAMFLL